MKAPIWSAGAKPGPAANARSAMRSKHRSMASPIRGRLVGERGRQDRDQHQQRADQRVQHELDRRVDAVRAAPDPDDQVHRDEHDLPEDVEEEQVEREEHADHADLEHEEGDHVFLDAGLDRDPRARMQIHVSVVVSTTKAADSPSTPSLYWMPKMGIQSTVSMNWNWARPTRQIADQQQQRHDPRRERDDERGRARPAARQERHDERPDERQERDDRQDRERGRSSSRSPRAAGTSRP